MASGSPRAATAGITAITGGYYGYPVVYTAPGVPPRVHPTVPIGKPIFHFPNAGGTGTVAVHRPQGDGGSQPPSGSNASAPMTNGSSTYHRPGLITEDAPGGSIRGQGRVTGSEMGLTSAKRPTIQQMIGSRQIDDDARGTGLRDAGIRNVGTRDNGWSSTNRGGTTVTRGSEAGTRAGMGSGRASTVSRTGTRRLREARRRAWSRRTVRRTRRPRIRLRRIANPLDRRQRVRRRAQGRRRSRSSKELHIREPRAALGARFFFRLCGRNNW